MIDTHVHYISKSLSNLQEEIENINKSYLTAVVNVGIDIETSKEVINISGLYPKFYSVIGIHPFSHGKVDNIINLYKESDKEKIVAIGETGLDIRESNISLHNQTQKFIDSIVAANYLKLPLVIHANGTNNQVMQILKKYNPEYGFIFHCFQPDLEVLREIMRLDGYISVGLPITRLTAKSSIQVVKEVLMNHLLIETDYPEMRRDTTGKLFDDLNMVLRKVAEIKNIPVEELELILDNNAKRIYRKIN